MTWRARIQFFRPRIETLNTKARVLQLRNAGALACALLIAGCAISPSANVSKRDQTTESASDSRDDAASSDDLPESARGFHQTGIASWYGRAFNGRRTASGERFNMHAMTAAHRTLPLGSWVRVTVWGKKQSVLVRINDRGPFMRNRIIDLSYGAAVALGIAQRGSAKVELSIAPRPVSRS